MRLSTHSGQLERYLGREEVDRISSSMLAWYGPPIAVAGVPGRVFAHGGGDFRGRIAGGTFASMACRAEEYIRRFPRRLQRWTRNQQSTCNAGFASLSDLIAEKTGGKGQDLAYTKNGATGVVAVSSSLWLAGPSPAAGANAANAPGGTVPTSATTGAIPFVNAAGGDTLHITGAPSTIASVAGNTLLLYDRLFAVNKTMASTATEAVTGVPTRYQSTTPGAADYVGGNFLFVEVGGTALAATAHNWTVCTYRDQADAASTMPSLVGNSGAIVRRLDHPVGQWYAPLEAGDVGIKALTQMQCSASVATGVVNFVIGHPLAMFPHLLANFPHVFDGINSAFNLTRIFDGACLAFLEVTKAATTATNYTGVISTCSG